MGMLTGPEILRRINAGEIIIEPLGKVGPNSVDLTLAPLLRMYQKHHRVHHQMSRYYDLWRNGQTSHPPRLGEMFAEPLDMAKKEEVVDVPIPDDGLVLWPGLLYLGTTNEHTETPTLIPGIEGRSSVGRLGLSIHVTAGFGDQNFSGTWTLEMTVPAPVRIYGGVRICQIFYSEATGEPEPYQGKYQNQFGPQPSGLWREFCEGK